MKLSIIVPIYKKSKFLSKYLERLERIKSENYEIVFVIDTNIEKVVEIIESKVDSLSGDLKIIYNSKRLGRGEAIDQGIREMSGDYLIIQSLTNKFDENFVTDILARTKSKPADIIEFRPHINYPIKFKPKLRKTFNKVVNINENKSVIAYSYPFIFNKIFKSTIAKEALNTNSISKTVNNRLSINLLYRMFLVANTYTTLPISPVRSYVKIEKTFNPLGVSREWDQIISSDLYKNYIQEIEYARYFSELFIIPAYIKILKNQLMIKKVKSKFISTFSDDCDLFTINKYYLTNTKETEVMRNFKNKSSAKAYKEL